MLDDMAGVDREELTPLLPNNCTISRIEKLSVSRRIILNQRRCGAIRVSTSTSTLIVPGARAAGRLTTFRSHMVEHVDRKTFLTVIPQPDLPDRRGGRARPPRAARQLYPRAVTVAE
jgi:hypothetical protein